MRRTQPLHRALRQNPDRPMTIYGERVRTVRETADRVSRLAGGLKRLGVGEDDRVAVLALNSDRYHETYFAAWWAGAVACGLNIRWSAAELAYALDDTGCEVLFVDDAQLPLLPELRRRCPGLRTVIHCGDAEAPEGTIGYEELIATSEPVADAQRGGRDRAVIVYTGGTTGVPKGVVLSHQGMAINALGSQVSHGGAHPAGVTLVSAPMFHVAALGSWGSQNFVGGTQLFLPSFTPETVLAAIERHQVTTMLLVPTMLQMLADHPDADRYDLTSLRTVGYGAAPMSPAVRERAVKLFPNCGFYQGYGMSECGTAAVLDQEHHRAERKLRSVGRTAAHCEVMIADPDGAELPRGEVGEILMRGGALMLGYWNKPEETAEALRGGWMHTGDAAYMDEDGYLFIVDRLKDMIITGGENVYTNEVENAVNTHPAVATSAVVGLPDPLWGERVHAVVVLHPGATATAEAIRAHVKTLIAGYKSPRTVEFTDALPLSAAGKVLKRELRAQRAG